MRIPAKNLKNYKDYDDGILKAIDDLKTQNDTLKTQAEEWKEKVEKFQDDLLAIKRKPIQIKDPTVDTVEIQNPFKKKPSAQDPDFDQ